MTGIATENRARVRRVITALAAAIVFAASSGCSNDLHAVSPSSEQPMVLYSDFSATPDGPVPGRFDSGQQASLAPFVDPSWEMFAARGRLTFAPTTEGPAAGFLRTPDLGRPIKRIGMEWVFDPGTGDGGPGVAAMGVSGDPIDPTDTSAPPLPIHFLARRDIWNFSVSPGPFNGDSRLITIATGNFDPPLSEDGITVHRVDIRVDGPNVSLQLPDGSISHFSDPRVAAWAARFGFFEVFTESALTDSRAGLVKVWADA